MLFRQPLDEVLGSRPKVALLRLLRRSQGSHTGRELARLTNLDPKTVHAALRDLAAQGPVRVRRAGASMLFQWNAEHVLARDFLDPLFAAEEGLIAGYAADLLRRLDAPVLAAVLFGSVARGSERAASDVDLFLVLPSPRDVRRAQESLDRATVDLAGAYGNPPQVILRDRESFRRDAASGDRFTAEVLRTGHILHGRPFAEILKRGA